MDIIFGKIPKWTEYRSKIANSDYGSPYYDGDGHGYGLYGIHFDSGFENTQDSCNGCGYGSHGYGSLGSIGDGYGIEVIYDH